MPVTPHDTPDADLALLCDLCALPTAAFLEDAVLAYVDGWAKRRRNLTATRDAFGNRLLLAPGRRDRDGGGGRPRTLFVAHADHPAFCSGVTKDGVLHSEFRGGVAAACCVPGTKVRFADVLATVAETACDDKGGLVSTTFNLPRGKRVPPGVVGMFDFGKPFARVRRGRLVARACDDLAGLAACLAALDAARGKADATVGVLVTRAEEVGFVGAIAAARAGDAGLLRPDDRLISIETSSAQAAAPMGGGCVLRVGDKTSVFDAGLTYFLASRGQALADAGTIAFRRALMPGGTCEATAFAAYGFVASAACVPLGNYHNMDRENTRMGPEQIDLGDWRHLVAYLSDIARNAHMFDGKQTMLRERLAARFDGHKHLFDAPAASLCRVAGPGAD